MCNDKLKKKIGKYFKEKEEQQNVHKIIFTKKMEGNQNGCFTMLILDRRNQKEKNIISYIYFKVFPSKKHEICFSNGVSLNCLSIQI